MIDRNRMVRVINKFNGTVGYDVPDLGVHRNFYPNESKEILFDELEKLVFAPGGYAILSEYLEIQDEDVIRELFHKKPEPEYHYTRNDIKELMVNGSLDQFLDCLDFAPVSVKEMIKDMAVDLPLNDIEKRDAIQEKLGFDVTRAISIKNTKFDGAEAEDSKNIDKNSARRAAPIKGESVGTPTGRRYKPAAK